MNEPPGSLEDQEARIVELVMSYFAHHPRAMDTVAGIVEWWIPPGGIRADAQTMRRVLDRLTDEGILERVGSGEYAHYRRKIT